MDIFSNAGVKLLAMLNPTAILLVILLLVGAVLATIKIMGTLQKKKTSRGIFGLLTGQASPSIADEVTLNDIQKKLEVLLLTVDTLASNHTISSSSDKLMFALAELKHEIIEGAHEYEKHVTTMSEGRQEMNEHFKSMLSEFSDVKHYIKMQDVKLQQDSEAAKELMNRMHGILGRAITQIEKADEFTRAAVPEFRSYHKELNNDLSGLSKDIALIERSIQNQINNTQQIKLR